MSAPTHRQMIGLMAATLYAAKGASNTYFYADAVREAEALWREVQIMDTHVCRECGNEFRSRSARAIYCSAPCRLKGWRKERRGFTHPWRLKRALKEGA